MARCQDFNHIVEVLDIDMADIENTGPGGVEVFGEPEPRPVEAGLMVPNQANWANRNKPSKDWRRSGRLIRTPSGVWFKNNRDGRLYSIQ